MLENGFTLGLDRGILSVKFFKGLLSSKLAKYDQIFAISVLIDKLLHLAISARGILAVNFGKFSTASFSMPGPRSELLRAN